MDSSRLSFFFFFFFFPFLLFKYTALCVNVCPDFTCGDGLFPTFPFGLTDQPPDHCGFPVFDLSCNKRGQTIIDLPSGQFLVNRIDYRSQWIYINDPGICLPRRILSLNLWGSGFKAAFPKRVTFFNCSSLDNLPQWANIIRCLSRNGYTVIAMYSEFDTYTPSSCWNISTVQVPLMWSPYQTWTPSLDLTQDLQLFWSTPSCGACVSNGGTCGFKSDTKLDIECSGLPKTSHSRSARYGLIIGVGIPVYLAIIGLVFYVDSKVRAYERREPMNIELPTTTMTTRPSIALTGLDTELPTTTMTTRPSIALTGLDTPTIESYPKTVLGEDGRLPNPNDGLCSICLCDYLPRESLRIIRECNHYFHTICIDEWLKMNATCPFCRAPPDKS